jgi:hypothetical protein
MYDNQNRLFIIPLIRHAIIVWVSSIIPVASGCFVCVNVILVSIIADMSIFVMSGGIIVNVNLGD